MVLASTSFLCCPFNNSSAREPSFCSSIGGTIVLIVEFGEWEDILFCATCSRVASRWPSMTMPAPIPVLSLCLQNYDIVSNSKCFHHLKRNSDIIIYCRREAKLFHECFYRYNVQEGMFVHVVVAHEKT